MALGRGHDFPNVKFTACMGIHSLHGNLTGACTRCCRHRGPLRIPLSLRRFQSRWNTWNGAAVVMLPLPVPMQWTTLGISAAS